MGRKTFVCLPRPTLGSGPALVISNSLLLSYSRFGADIKALTNQLTTWSRVILEKLTVAHLAKNWTRRLITAFTRTRHRSLSWARWIQSTFFHLFLKNNFYIIFSSMPMSSEWHLLLRLPNQNFARISHRSHTCFMPGPSHPPWFHHLNTI
jgi:hypothetical protein